MTPTPPPPAGPVARARRDGIFYVTDAGFALPTAASALAVRRKTPRDRADVRILLTGMTPEATRRMREVLQPEGIHVDELPADSFSDFAHGLFNKTHVPMATLGRFVMLECVPDIYDRILYLDGDTWPVGDPAALLEVPLPAGALAAAEDQSFFYAREIGATGDRVRRYFQGLGLAPRQGYFNAGVLLADSGTWRALCADAFAFFRANTARCIYHDQSALNAVAGSRRIRLSPRWNFAQMFYDWGVPPTPEPQIVHFCGGGKPWALPRHRFHGTLERAFADLAALRLDVERPNAAALRGIEQAMARQALKQRTILLPRMLARRHAYRGLVQTAVIA